MARGGKRPGAGRKKGVPNKATQGRQAMVAKTGITPLDYMLAVMRDEHATHEDRMEAAKAAAPYVHPRLSQIDAKSEVTHRYVARMPERAKTADEWQKQHAPESRIQ